MTKRLLATIRFFDLQSYALTASEVHRFLVADPQSLTLLDGHYELGGNIPTAVGEVSLFSVLSELDSLVKSGQLAVTSGFYTLPGKENLVHQRLMGYLPGLKRERRIRHFLPAARLVPFVRGIALAGSQAMGFMRETSDIDLLIITDSRFMWLSRTLLSLWFQLFGVRRHGKLTVNRFCLNHYIAQPREVDAERNLYKAMEYGKLRPVIGAGVMRQFQLANQHWMRYFLPQLEFVSAPADLQPTVQHWLEKLFDNRLGQQLEQWLKTWQMSRIKQEKYIFIRDDELSFHPESRHEALLSAFFEFQKQQSGEAVQSVGEIKTRAVDGAGKLPHRGEMEPVRDRGV